MAVGQNPVPLVNIKIGGAWVFIRPNMEAYVTTHGHMQVQSLKTDVPLQTKPKKGTHPSTHTHKDRDTGTNQSEP